MVTILFLALSNHICSLHEKGRVIVSDSFSPLLQSEEPPLSVLHFQYAEWPDHGVPKDTIAAREIVKRLHTLPPSLGPIVVHCRFA